MTDIIQHKGAGTVSFPCPKCGKTTITRTLHERQIVTKYTCPQCSFEGPN